MQLISHSSSLWCVVIQGLYDVYTQQGAAAKEKLRGVLEKLVTVAPASVNTALL
jgi:hypothetical protein